MDENATKPADAYANIIRKIANSRMIIAIITIATIILFIHSLTLVPELGFNFTEDSDRGPSSSKPNFQQTIRSKIK